MQGIFLCGAGKFGSRSFQFTNELQWILFYTMMFMSCILTSFLYDVTQHDNNKWSTVSLIAISTNRVDEDLF